jgi:hypothetical protein
MSHNPYECKYLFELPKPKLIGYIVDKDGNYIPIIEDKYIQPIKINFIPSTSIQTD